MPLSGGLYGCEDPTYWKTVFDVYWDVLKAKGGKKKNLSELDKWYQEELPGAIAGRKEKYLTQAEVVKLMEWKLARGKFRPRLQQLVATNSSETVEICTRKAFQLLPDVAAAITELSQLKAVGPATASAILAAGAPEAVAFMADEAMESIPGLTPIRYTLKHYILYLGKIQLCVKKLNQVDTEKVWTPHRVEMCLWAWAMAQKLCPSLLQTLSLGGEKAADEADEDVRPTKKRKTR
ncbi:uncharacterized protein LOC102947292 [Chelonia mydas]|uniref:uncharacterized protein LOC102947292 n=1 Tax=Chelonia mydas TaxID=8469 RepID=UPI0018A236C0|nr:uncharacterized protein LOC102947292 [Chelonia mydas]XP_037766317.1 uncharacterized protein LOC102947292 [Chelonia mydas]XP_037766318.1 uncharacterized protein LOC102947292 [Chelonia mydas]XP_037766319.1 uncharacterized protein LOC102947292 [Chelonia mydas]